MSASAIFLMIVVQGTFIVVTGFFFMKVLKTPPKMEPDSYEDNDDFPDELRQHEE